jgi:hypothetical protein
MPPGLARLRIARAFAAVGRTEEHTKTSGGKPTLIFGGKESVSFESWSTVKISKSECLILTKAPLFPYYVDYKYLAVV